MTLSYLLFRWVWLPHFVNYFTRFDYFFVNIQFWNAKFQGMNEKNMSHLLVQKSQKRWGKLGGQKSDPVTKHIKNKKIEIE